MIKTIGRYAVAWGTFVVLLVAGSALHGNLLLIGVLLAQTYGIDFAERLGGLWEQSWFAGTHFAGLEYIIAFSVTITMLGYHGVSGGLYKYYYIDRKDRAEEWKVQPKHFPSAALLREQIMLGTFNMLLGSSVTGFLITYMINKGPLLTLHEEVTVAFDMRVTSIPYLILQFPLIFLAEDAFAYYAHRYFHTRFFYTHVHKTHHRYRQPTAWSTSSMHTAEFLILNVGVVLPAFTLPLHKTVFAAMLAYIFLHGMLDHSGIKFTSVLPWQHITNFHDDHHRLFHVNFGLNSNFFDVIHGTCARDDRVYGETVFGGFGKEAAKVT